MPALRKAAADALVRAHAVGDALDVGAGGLADGGDGVDVGDFQREEAVCGVLDQLGRVEVGEHDRRVEGLVDFPHRGDGAVRGNADDNAVGLHQVLDGGAFAKEFGIADDVDVGAGIVAADGLRDFLAGLDRDGAFIDDDLVFLDVRGDLARDALDEAEVDAAIRLRRRGHGDEDDLRGFNRVADGRSESQAAGGDVLFNEVLEARLVDGDVPGLQQVDLLFIIIDADHFVTHFSETGARDQSDVSRTDDRKIHAARIVPVT